MTSDRPYRKAMSLDQVLRELTKYSGSQFDPVCVDAMMRLLDVEAEGFIRKDQKFDIYAFIEG
jgi:HD-GYP domain-containing protein (c-di-GMP phosphodiesterase class II)